MTKTICTDKQLEYIIILRQKVGEKNYRASLKEAGLKKGDAALMSFSDAWILIGFLKQKPKHIVKEEKVAYTIDDTLEDMQAALKRLQQKVKGMK